MTARTLAVIAAVFSFLPILPIPIIFRPLGSAGSAAKFSSGSGKIQKAFNCPEGVSTSSVQFLTTNTEALPKQSLEKVRNPRNSEYVNVMIITIDFKICLYLEILLNWE